MGKKDNVTYSGKTHIAGRPYDITVNKKTSGGEFYCWGKKRKGSGEIFIENTESLNTLVEILFHEIMEATLTEEYKRYQKTGLSLNNQSLTFLFDHEYFDMLCPKVLSALLDTGFVQLVDMRAK